MHRIKKLETPKCPHCPQQDETVLHYLLECPQYADARNQLRHKLLRKARNISSLLADARCTKHTLSYVHATQRFKLTHGNLTPPRDKDK